MQTEMRLAKLQCFPYRQGRPQANAIDVAVLDHGVKRNFDFTPCKHAQITNILHIKFAEKTDD